MRSNAAPGVESVTIASSTTPSRKLGGTDTFSEAVPSGHGDPEEGRSRALEVREPRPARRRCPTARSPTRIWLLRAREQDGKVVEGSHAENGRQRPEPVGPLRARKPLRSSS